MFSDEKADRATTFIERELTHGIGHHAGTPFLLRDWQRKIIRDIFGNVDDESTTYGVPSRRDTPDRHRDGAQPSLRTRSVPVMPLNV